MNPFKKPGYDLRGFSCEIPDVQFNNDISP